jgi:hypothetical protein
MADSSLSAQSIVGNHAFRETLLDFAKTHALPAPDEPRLEWNAWKTAFADAFRAVIASADHCCVVLLLEALLTARVTHGSQVTYECGEA